MRQHIQWQAKAELPYILNLDPDFKPFQKGIEISHKSFSFKGGEPHLQITALPDYTQYSKLIITQRYNKPEDIFNILLANDAAKRMGFKDISLIFPYFPAARQDRVCNQGEPLTIKIFADLINGCGFEEVVVLCPHSEVTPALINNVSVLDELSFVQKTIDQTKNGHKYNIVCPDAGAGKRVNKIVQFLAANNGFVDFNEFMFGYV